MFGIWRAWRRRRWEKVPFPASWGQMLREEAPFYEQLAPEMRAQFEDWVQAFVAEKHFFGAGDFEITERVKVVIAATAVRLVLYLDLSYYDRLTEIIVYASHYRHRESNDVIFGEAHEWGTVVLSWEAVLAGLANPDDGHDTAAHEFAHGLDRGGGAFDGTRRLRKHGHCSPWANVMTEHFAELRAGARRTRKVLRRYGATNEAEFFAVATESFFEKPEQMKAKTSELFEQLCRFYGVDPTDSG